MEKTFYNIFKTFFKTGTMLLGGGYVILPILQNELVEKKNWLGDLELHEFYALAQSVPGIIAANVAVFTGYKLRGISGAFAAITGITMPAFLAIIVIARFVYELSYLKFVQSIFWGIGIGVLMLIIMAAREFWARSVIDRFSSVIFFLSFVLSACFKAPPTVIIILAIFIGIWVQYQKRLENRE